MQPAACKNHLCRHSHLYLLFFNPSSDIAPLGQTKARILLQTSIFPSRNAGVRADMIYLILF
ncbi:hypothetical protein B2G52_05530 [Neisseria lactamica]|uniref:Uncharacterized protein n=1 Tax=Neisseria lactamica TaxID=486 RepID=A0AAU8VQL4_NEILA|nr:hypothetical protein B2G52_05530 [Neisseria lactamica]